VCSKRFLLEHTLRRMALIAYTDYCKSSEEKYADYCKYRYCFSEEKDAF
jgi:hypothetical protein